MILSSLRKAPAHGFEVIKRLRDSGSGALHLKEGSLYPALYRLEKSGLIAGEWEAGESGRRGPRRRVYTITDRGAGHLDQARNEFYRFASVMTAILGPAKG